MSKQKERDIKIIDRKAPRVAIQITELAVNQKEEPAPAIGRALTVTNLGEARKLNIKAMRRRAVARIRGTRWNPWNLMTKSHSSKEA